MALLPRRRRTLAQQAQGQAKPSTEAEGGSGRFNSTGFLDFDEINPNLRGRLGFEAFDKMWRTDADCRKALTMVVAAMVAGNWDIEAPGDDEAPTTDAEQRATELVRYALFEAMSPKLPAHLWTALTVAGRCGNAPFEQVWRLDSFEGKDAWVLDTLDLRLPRSVDKYNQDGHRLASIEQFFTGRPDKPRSLIEAGDLVFYRFGAEGDNWEGQSLLRAAYKHWKYKDAIERIQAMGIERSALGVPTGYPPENASPEDKDTFEDFLSSVRASDATFFMAPGPHADNADNGQGWRWEFVTPGQSRGDSSVIPDALKHHGDKIAASVLQEFMRQGMNAGSGTNAAAGVQQDPFLQLCEALVTIVVEDAINEQLIPRIVDLNVSGVDRYPKLSCSLIDSTSLTELADYVQKLSSAGALRPEPRLEAFLRSRADLPEADEKAIEEKQQQEADQAAQDAASAHQQALELVAAKAPAPSGGRQMSLSQELTQRQLARADRPLKPHEAHMSLDRIESAIDGARAQFEQAAGGHVMDLARSLAQAAQDGRVAPGDPPQELVDALTGEMRRLYDTGRQTVREELMNQAHAAYSLDGNPFDAKNLTVGALDRLKARAVAAADAIRAAIALALHRTSLHKGAGPADLQLAAERAATAALRGAAQDHAAAALNAGRVDQADEDADQIAGAYYTSILDGNRCRDCASADDDVLRPLDDPVRLAHVPPNPGCYGGGRCRCLESYVFKSEAPASA